MYLLCTRSCNVECMKKTTNLIIEMAGRGEGEQRWDSHAHAIYWPTGVLGISTGLYSEIHPYWRSRKKYILHFTFLCFHNTTFCPLPHLQSLFFNDFVKLQTCCISNSTSPLCKKHLAQFLFQRPLWIPCENLSWKNRTICQQVWSWVYTVQFLDDLHYWCYFISSNASADCSFF